MNPWIIAGPSLGVYLTGWLVTARIFFDRVNEYPDMADMDGMVSLMFGLIWPVIAVFIGPWLFVTGNARRKIRRQKSAERTALLEYDIYGRKPLG